MAFLPGAIHSSMTPADRRLAPARRALGESGYAAVWAEGRALSLDQAAEDAVQVAAHPPAALHRHNHGAARPPLPCQMKGAIAIEQAPRINTEPGWRAARLR